MNNVLDIGGKIVRDAWIEWAKEQPAPKASWLVPYESLSEPDKEADRRIFERVVLELAKFGSMDTMPTSTEAVVGAFSLAKTIHLNRQLLEIIEKMAKTQAETKDEIRS